MDPSPEDLPYRIAFRVLHEESKLEWSILTVLMGSPLDRTQIEARLWRRRRGELDAAIGRLHTDGAIRGTWDDTGGEEWALTEIGKEVIKRFCQMLPVYETIQAYKAGQLGP